MIENNHSLAPYTGLAGSDYGYPVVPASGSLGPMTAAVPAVPVDSGAVTAMDERQLRYLERETRIKALTMITTQQNAVASEWLRFRQPYERNIRIETLAESRDRRWLFASGERLRVTTTINIW